VSLVLRVGCSVGKIDGCCMIVLVGWIAVLESINAGGDGAYIYISLDSRFHLGFCASSNFHEILMSLCAGQNQVL